MRPARRWLLPALPLCFLAVVLVALVLLLLVEGLSAGASELRWAEVWTDDYLRWRVLWSLAQAAITCALALLLGLPCAWVLARYEFPGRVLALRLLALPFVVPTLVAAMGVLALWGPRGVFGAPLAAAGIEGVGTPWLLLYGNLFFNLCLVVRAGVDADRLANFHKLQREIRRETMDPIARQKWVAELKVRSRWVKAKMRARR